MKLLTIAASFLFVTVNFSYGQTGAPGNEPVYPFSVNPLTLPAPGQETAVEETHVRGDAPDPQLPERVRSKTLEHNPNDKSVVEVGYQSDAPIFIWNSWNGPNQNGWVPADVDIAQGGGASGWIIIVTNEQFHVYRKSDFALVLTNTFQNWFNNVGAVGSIFDPKVIWDDWSNRWVFLALGASSSPFASYYYLSVSQTSDPTGQWWNYRLNAHVDGSTATNNWADYPGLGFSYPVGGSGNVGCVAICSNQYQNGGPFQYAKVRLLKTSQLYTGAGVTWFDFWNWNDANNEKAFTWQPARQIFNTTNALIYLFNTKWYGSNVVTLWRVDNPTAVTPSLTRQATVSVSGYLDPPNNHMAPSLGGGTVDAFDCRTQNVWYMNGHIYSAWVTRLGSVSGVHYVRINTATNAVADQIQFGNPAFWFIHPSVCPEFKSPFSNGFVGIQFASTSAAAYPSHCVIGYDGTALSTYSCVNGTGPLSSGFSRYGDYGGIAPDDEQNGVFWSSGMIAKPGSWGTGVFRFAFNPPPIGIQNHNGQVPSEYSLSQNYPNPFNPVTTITFGIPVSSLVNITVYDMLGREITVLLNEHKQAGMYDITFDASSVPSGVYLYKITSGDFTDTKKMILVK